jgi:hypothetical protein
MKNIYKKIIFTKTPLKSYFKYQDEFQIYPVDDKYLITKKHNHYPIFLELKINKQDIIKPNISKDLEDLEEIISETAIINTKEDKIINLLNLFSTFTFFKYNTEGNWVIPITTRMSREEKLEIDGSEFLYNIFCHKGINFEISDFTDVSNQYKPINVIEYSEYYQNEPNYDYNQKKEITLPNNIIMGLRAYYNLDFQEKKNIDSAINYSCLSMQLMHDKTTLGVVSAFTAIETVMNIYYRGYKPQNCEKCGQPKYKISKRYLDFLLEFIGNEDGFKKKFENLYRLRSKIVHTGFSFSIESIWNELTDQEQNSELVTILEIVMLSKLSVINYLILTSLGKKKKHHS